MKTRKKHLTAVQQIWATLFFVATLLPLASAEAQTQRTIRSLQEGSRRLVQLTQSARNLRPLPLEQATAKQREYVLRYNRILAQTHLLRIAQERAKASTASTTGWQKASESVIESARRAEELRYRSAANNNCQFLDEASKECAAPLETAPKSNAFKLRLGQVAISLFAREVKTPVQLAAIDLSNKFAAPVSQVVNGKMTKTGVGFALSSAVQFATGKIISPILTYATVIQYQKEINGDCESLKQVGLDTNVNVISPDEVFMRPSLCLIDGSPTAQIQITDSKNISGSTSSFVTELKKGKPVFVTLSTQARRTKEDWIQFQPSSLNHAVLIVGYNEGYNPFTLKYEPYFILRDSASLKAIHVKTSASDLLKYISSAKVIRGAAVSE